jgi:hypothetical protein
MKKEGKRIIFILKNDTIYSIFEKWLISRKE